MRKICVALAVAALLLCVLFLVSPLNTGERTAQAEQPQGPAVPDVRGDTRPQEQDEDHPTHPETSEADHYLRIQLRVFSGRVDPVFRIDDPEVIAAIKQRLEGLPSAPPPTRMRRSTRLPEWIQIKASGMPDFPSVVRVGDGIVHLTRGDVTSYGYDVHGLESLLVEEGAARKDEPGMTDPHHFMPYSRYSNRFWERLPSGVDGEIADFCFIDGQRGWLAEAGGTISHTSDGGLSWTTQIIPEGMPDNKLSGLTLVKAADNRILAWAVTEAGDILHSDNAEAGDIIYSNNASAWVVQKEGSPKDTVAPLKCVYALDEQSVWAGGAGGLLKTGDGGEQWSTVDLGEDDKRYVFRRLFFADQARGIGLAAAIDTSADGAPQTAVILTTADGGDTWNKEREVPAPASSIQVMRFRQGVQLWHKGELLFKFGEAPASVAAPIRTADQVLSDKVAFSLSVQSEGPQGVKTILNATRDGGKTWTASLVSPVDLHDVSFVSHVDGTGSYKDWLVATGENGAILSSQRGGIVWTVRISDINADLRDVFFVNKDNGWIVGGVDETNARGGNLKGGILVLRTGDCGKTWRKYSQVAPKFDVAHEVPEIATAVFFTDVNKGWMVTRGKTKQPHEAIKQAWSSGGVKDTTRTPGTEYGRILATSDGGKNWSEAYFGLPLVDLKGTGQTLLAAGYGIVVSKDGGKTWAAQKSPLFPSNVDAVTLPPAGRAMAVGGGAVVATSKNRGRNWTVRPVVHENADGPVLLRDVVFASLHRACAIGASGDGKPGVWTTPDFGKSWSRWKIYSMPGTTAPVALQGLELARWGLGGWAVGERGTFALWWYQHPRGRALGKELPAGHEERL